MKLTELIGFRSPRLPALASPAAADPEIAGLTVDSRQVRAGLSVCRAGRRAAADGRRFAGEAVAQGAAAILTDDAGALDLDADARPRRDRRRPEPAAPLALLAARFFGRQPRTIAAVTGTNGKTSVAHFTREIWKRARPQGGEPRHARPRDAAAAAGPAR